MHNQEAKITSNLGSVLNFDAERIRQLSEQVPDAEQYHRNTPRKTIKEKRKAMLGGAVNTINVPVEWLQRYGTEAALFLALHVSYAGSQSDRDGYQYNSALEIYRKTGIKPHRQKRIRESLSDLGVIQAKKGGIGNKWMVCPNISLIELIDALEREEREIVEDAQSGEPLEVAKCKAEVNSLDSVQKEGAAFETVSKELSRQSQKGFQDSVQSHNRETTEKHRESIYPGEMTHVSKAARPLVVVDDEKEESRQTKKIERCVATLKDRVDFGVRTLGDVIAEMAKEYPDLDPEAVSRHIAESATESIRSPRYIRVCFERSEQRRQDGDERDAASVHERREAAQDKPKRADWYTAFSEGAVEVATVQGWIDAGMGHAAITARLEARAA
jgi:hypothetical protein